MSARTGLRGDVRVQVNDALLTTGGIRMLDSTSEIDAAIKRLKSKRSIDASLEADIRTALVEQLEEGMTVNYLGHPVPKPRLSG